MSDDNAVIEITPQTDLAVSLTDRAIEAMAQQRKALREFVQSQLKEGLDGDYAKIPGTDKFCLLKPGAEKLANIFRLGSRIAEVEKEIDHAEGFAMYTYTVEVFHVPTGKPISQCQGSANSLEKSYEKKSLGASLNTIQKMAQKRAYVGAVIIAVGASDFFTQDMEDAAQGSPRKSSTPRVTSARSRSQEQEQVQCDCGEPMMVSRYEPNMFYCKACKNKKPMTEGRR